MSRKAIKKDLTRSQILTQRAFASIARFLHIEAVSGIVLLGAATVALLWANSVWESSYHDLWHTTLSIALGPYAFSQTLHFWINDVLMTFFFLVVGMEIRREIHEGTLQNAKQALLPLVAAFGGVLMPALVYVAFNNDPLRAHGWAVPTATDIAFAVGVLALLGRSIPGSVRIFLLALAIIDDIIAVLIIAIFYSGGLDYSGFALAAIGVGMVISLQRMGIGSAFAYVVPGAVIWIGILVTGAHPTLAGVALGLMTPVVSVRMRERPLAVLSRIAQELTGSKGSDQAQIEKSLHELRFAQRELLPPVVRVQRALHPWVAFVVMPLFALANAGVHIGGEVFALEGASMIMTGVVLALVVGKPLGIVGMSWIAIRLGWCKLPEGVTWSGVWLVGLLAGIGFTMSIFIAMLAFNDAGLLNAAKLGVLGGSFLAALLGVVWGKLTVCTPTK